MFSSMLDEVRRGCPAQETVRALKERVLSTPVVDKFQKLMSSGPSPLCLFPTRQSCQDFNSEMLTKLDSELKEIKCVDEVDETKGTFKCSKKATKVMEKLNRDCNMTGGLEAVLKVAVGARVMLHRNIDTRSGLVNGTLGTVTTIRTYHVTVQFDGRRQPYQVERVKAGSWCSITSTSKESSSRSSWPLLSQYTSVRVCRLTVPSWTCRSRCSVLAWRT